MANEYIRREDAIETAVSAFNAWNLAMAAADGKREINLVFRRKELCKAVELVFRGAPAANVVDVVHARWLTDKWTKWPHRECTRCGIFIPVTVEVPDPYWQYCPNCGAKMDGGENDVSG